MKIAYIDPGFRDIGVTYYDTVSRKILFQKVDCLGDFKMYKSGTTFEAEQRMIKTVKKVFKKSLKTMDLVKVEHQFERNMHGVVIAIRSLYPDKTIECHKYSVVSRLGKIFKQLRKKDKTIPKLKNRKSHAKNKKNTMEVLKAIDPKNRIKIYDNDFRLTRIKRDHNIGDTLLYLLLDRYLKEGTDKFITL